MTKYDLCTGDIVLSTKGSYGIVLIGTNGDDQIKWYSNNKGQVINRFRSFSMINEDLTFKYIFLLSELCLIKALLMKSGAL